METYVINLLSSLERKEYMHDALGDLDITFHFIEAVDGRQLNDSEKGMLFNEEKCKKIYARDILPGEIGCTLSHQKCYKTMIENNIDYAMILEDDVRFLCEKEEINRIGEFIKQRNEPSVVLLSGRYWFGKKISKINERDIVTVYDAFLTQAYLINNAGARLLLNERPFFRADDWYHFKNIGLKLYAIKPHVTCEKYNNVSTVAALKPLYSGNYIAKLKLYSHELVKRIYKLFNRFEPEDNDRGNVN